jgi:hypothetical protein
VSPCSPESGNYRDNSFLNCTISQIRAVTPADLLVVRYEVLKLFQIDKFVHQPKANPWSKNAFIDMIYKVYPELLKRAGYKLKEKLF